MLQWMKQELNNKLALFGFIMGFMPIACAILGDLIAAGAFLCVLLLLRVVEILSKVLQIRTQMNEILAKTILQAKQTEAVYATMLGLQAVEVVNARHYATGLMNTMKTLYESLGQLALSRGQYPEDDDEDSYIENVSLPAKLH